MAFKQGRRPSVVIEPREHREFQDDLRDAGYKPHKGPRIERDGEIRAWVAPVGNGERHVHVQEVRRRNGDVAVYAHTEPAGVGPSHAVSAVTDGASYQGGSRVLREDLRRRGWDV